MKPTPILPSDTPFTWSARVLKKYEAADKARGRKKAVDAPQRPARARELTLSTPAPRHISAVKRGECEWCGQPARGGACSEHDDLGQIDPRFNPEAAFLTRKATSPRRDSSKKTSTGSQRQGV